MEIEQKPINVYREMIYRNLEHEGEPEKSTHKTYRRRKTVALFHLACAVYTMLTKTNEIKRDQEKSGKINKAQNPGDNITLFVLFGNIFKFSPQNNST